MTGNKIASKITKVSKNSQKNNSETITSENDIRYMSPEERHKINFNSIIMENQKMINLLDNTLNQQTKFRTKYWVEINDELQGTYNKDNQIRFKTSMLRSRLCDYSDAYIPVKGYITVANTAAQGQVNNDTNKKVIIENCAPFTNCRSRVSNTQVDDASYIDVM